MLELARRNIGQSGLAARVDVQLVDAKCLPFEAGAFSAVMSNSIVHHIPEPSYALAEMVRLTRSGGVLFVRDLLRPADLDTLRSLVAQYAGTANAHGQQMFADSLHAALTMAEVRSLVGALGFAPETVQQTTDRHWTWAARKAAG
jgi:ubiquinone/menaquinone biosynthesis C-methylase UbiE